MDDKFSEEFRVATPGDLVRSLATVTALPEATVAVHDRHLRAAGLRRSGGRGRSAARVGPRDAAVLLVSVLAGGNIVGTGETIRRYVTTRPQRQESNSPLPRDIGIPELASLSPDHSFIDAVEALISAAATGSLATAPHPSDGPAGDDPATCLPLIEVAAIMPGTMGEIRLAGLPHGATINLRYALPSPWDGEKSPSKTAIKRWESSPTVQSRGRNFERYQRVTTPVIIHLARTISGRMEE